MEGINNFYIKNVDFESVLKALSPIIYEIVDFDFNWKLLFVNEDEPQKRFVLYNTIGEWTYLQTNNWNDNMMEAIAQYKELVKKLSESLQTEVYYFFEDGVVSCTSWIFANNGIITRAYYQGMNTVFINERYSQTEFEIRENLASGFLTKLFGTKKYQSSNLYNELNEKLCVPIDILSNYKTIKVAIGQLNNQKK